MKLIATVDVKIMHTKSFIEHCLNGFQKSQRSVFSHGSQVRFLAFNQHSIDKQTAGL